MTPSLLHRLPGLLTVVALGAAGCAHTTRLETDPPGAEVYVNGQRVGVTPFEMQDSPGFGDDYEVSFRKDGYELKSVTLTQDQWKVPALVLAGVLAPCSCGLSALYFVPRSRTLEDRYGYAMVRKEPLPPLDGAEAPAPPVPAPAMPEPTTPAPSSAPAAPSSGPASAPLSMESFRF